MHANQTISQPPRPHDDFLRMLPVVMKYACLLFRNRPPLRSGRGRCRNRGESVRDLHQSEASRKESV